MIKKTIKTTITLKRGVFLFFMFLGRLGDEKTDALLTSSAVVTNPPLAVHQ